METDRDFEKLGFVPSNNLDEVSLAVREWLVEHVLPHVTSNKCQRDEIMAYDGGYLNVQLGGDFPHPQNPGVTFNAEASLNVQPHTRLARFELDTVEDPDGTRWYRSRVSCTVGWPSYSNDRNTSSIATIRANVIMTAARLATEFEQAFGNVIVWQRGPTIAERLARQEALTAQRLLDDRIAKAREAIRRAIHSTYKRMRVGSDGIIGNSFGQQVCKFSIDLENKTYDVSVYDACDPSDPISLMFTRTK